MEYSGLNMLQVLELPCDLYQAIYRRTTIDKMMSTKEGREYLEQCERFNTTELDDETFDTLNEIFK